MILFLRTMSLLVKTTVAFVITIALNFQFYQSTILFDKEIKFCMFLFISYTFVYFLCEFLRNDQTVKVSWLMYLSSLNDANAVYK